MQYKKRNGLLLPVEKPTTTPPPPEPDYWDCPHCGAPFDRTQPHEEYTVGVLGPGMAHIVCPSCKQCMGCKNASV
jgi:hypothetical protein